MRQLPEDRLRTCCRTKRFGAGLLAACAVAPLLAAVLLLLLLLTISRPGSGGAAICCCCWAMLPHAAQGPGPTRTGMDVEK